MSVYPSNFTDNISDGYHTFGELYTHRRALTAALARHVPAWRSKAHHPDNDPIFDGYFIIGLNLDSGPIGYHYKLIHWNNFDGIPELPHAPLWEGGTPNDTITRLLAHRPPRATPQH